MTDSSGSQTPAENEKDIKLMKIEAEAAVKEIRYAVEHADISTRLQTSHDVAYFNVRTKEGDRFCIELSALGYRVVSKNFDEIKPDASPEYYETIYALLDKHSPQYRLTFGEALAGKLKGLQQLQDESTNGNLPDSATGT